MSEPTRIDNDAEAVISLTDVVKRRSLASYSEEELRELYAAIAEEDRRIAEEDIEGYAEQLADQE